MNIGEVPSRRHTGTEHPAPTQAIPAGEPYLNVHHYFTDPATGQNVYDEDGELLLGWYWQFMNPDHTALSHLTGPYNDREEAQEHALHAWAAEAY